MNNAQIFSERYSYTIERLLYTNTATPIRAVNSSMKLENRYTNLTPKKSATVPTNAIERINAPCTRVDFAAITLERTPLLQAF